MVGIEKATLDACVQEAQGDRVVITRNGVPVALVVGLEGLDEEQVEWGSSDEFWKMIAERRRQGVMGRASTALTYVSGLLTMNCRVNHGKHEKHGKGSREGLASFRGVGVFRG
jgi:hypothetical protein